MSALEYILRKETQMKATENTTQAVETQPAQRTVEQMTDLEISTLMAQESQTALQAQATLFRSQQNIQIILAEIQKRQPKEAPKENANE